MSVVVAGLEAPIWSRVGVAEPARDGDVAAQADDGSRALWTHLDRAFPRSAAIGVAMIPWVLDVAARLSSARRVRHVAFVADVAFGGRREPERIAPPLSSACYRSTTATVHRLARDAGPAGPWDDWEARCLTAACLRVLGRLRAALAIPARERNRGSAEAELEFEIAQWLLAGTPPNATARRTARTP